MDFFFISYFGKDDCGCWLFDNEIFLVISLCMYVCVFCLLFPEIPGKKGQTLVKWEEPRLIVKASF